MSMCARVYVCVCARVYMYVGVNVDWGVYREEN